MRRGKLIRKNRPLIEALESRRLMAVTGVSIDGGDYVPPSYSNDSSQTYTPGSMSERDGGYNGSFTFHTDHDQVDGGVAYVAINWGDFMGPVQPQLMTAGTSGLSHTYVEEGNYTLGINVWDSAGSGNDTTVAAGGTYLGWSAGSNSATMEFGVGDAPLTDMSSPSSFVPNLTWTGVIGTFADSVPVMSDYSGMIDWGDGTALSKATFAINDNGAVSVLGSHTYIYQTDPDTGDVMFPLTEDELPQYTAVTHVLDAGGGTVDCITAMQAQLPTHLQGTAYPNKDSHKADATINLSVAAGTGTVYVAKFDGQGKAADLVFPMQTIFKATSVGYMPAGITATPAPTPLLHTNTTSIVLNYAARPTDIGKSFIVKIYDAGDPNCLGYKIVMNMVA